MKNYVETLIGATPQVLELMRTAKTGSLIEYTKQTRVEPLTLIEKRAVFLPFMHDVMQTLNSLFTAYYLQAVAMSVNVGRIETRRLLDKLNPNRDVLDNVIDSPFVGKALESRDNLLDLEAYRHRLPRLGKSDFEGYALGRVSVETREDILKGDYQANVSLEAKGDDKDKGSSRGFGRDTIKVSQETANLSVGKLVEVTIEDDGKKAVIPVQIRLVANAIDTEALTHILAIGNQRNSGKDRWHQWRAGQIEFVRDIILCQDLIKQHRANLVKDKTGVYSDTMKRRNRNGLSAIASGNPSVATASSMVVMTAESAKKLERQLGGKLSRFKVRESMFEKTYTMILVVVDPEWEQVTFYHRSIEQATELSVKELKSANKSTGPDVSEILKAYQLGNSPSI